MRSAILSAAAVALAAAQLCSAQTFTVCDPTKKTCPPDKALGKTITVDFTQGASSEFNVAAGTTMTYGSDGAIFSIKKETDAPTITSSFYLFFGKVDVVLKAAPGVGIVSSFVMESDDLDEIDWEWLGGDLTEVETNYFGKGNTTTYDRATYVPVPSPQTEFHTYSIDWTSSAIKWSIDGNVIRTLAYGDANGGKNFPQTPMQVKMGNWVGGSSTAPKGTVDWAGGLADFTKAPFPMYVKSVTIQDYSSGAAEYSYGDMSGSWQSIKSDGSSSDSGSSSSSSSSSGSDVASTKTTSQASSVSGTSTSSSTFSTITTAPIASGPGLGAGAITAATSSTLANNFTAASTTAITSASASTTTKAAGSAGTAVSANIALVLFSVALGYLVV